VFDADDLPAQPEPYEFQFEAATNTLFGVIKPLSEVLCASENTADLEVNTTSATLHAPQITLHTLNRQLRVEGFDKFFFFDNALDTFLKKVQQQEEGRVPLAEKRDASVSITISPDASSASAHVRVAYGGASLTSDAIYDALTKSQIAQDTIDTSKFDLLLNATSDREIVIATAIQPQPGADASFQQLIESRKASEHKADELGSIDHGQVYQFTVVEPGYPLMRRTPAAEGIGGKDVLGNTIPAKRGNDIEFSKPFEGVEAAPENNNLLVATIKGHPVFSKSGVKVDPIMVVESVDIHSGHIDYDGSLLVKQNIEPGFRVNVSGDLTVKGFISKAVVKAGGNIDVSGGINAEDLDDGIGCRVTAEGDITAKYLHHAHIECNGNLHVHEYIMNCEAIVEGFVNAGQERGKGCIIGGKISSYSGINAKILGSVAFIPTDLKLATDNEIYREIEQARTLLQHKNDEQLQLSTILESIVNQGESSKKTKVSPEKIQKIANTIEALNKNIERIEAHIAELESTVKPIETLVVKVTSKIYPNVSISITGRRWICEEQQRSCSISLIDGKISLEK